MTFTCPTSPTTRTVYRVTRESVWVLHERQPEASPRPDDWCLTTPLPFALRDEAAMLAYAQTATVASRSKLREAWSALLSLRGL